MRVLAVKYLKQSNRDGRWLYRRRVPKILQAMVPKSEFVITLGASEQEAISNYGEHHNKIEHLLALAKRGVNALSPAEKRDALILYLRENGLDPFSSGIDENERTGRDEVASRMIAPYEDTITGEYVDVPAETGALASALYYGVQELAPQPTVTDAFKFYLKEKAKPNEGQRKKQFERFRRVERELIAAMGGDKLVSEVTRADARAWRDRRVNSNVAATTIQREKNDLSAVIGLAISELDADATNPFKGLQLPSSMVAKQDERVPLPLDMIESVYADLQKGRSDLLHIWTLLDCTGARPSEISKLLVREVVLDHEVPHIVIEQREGRTLKTKESVRMVPIVGPALEVAQLLLGGNKNPDEPLFPRFADDGGMDRLSKAFSLRIRKYTKDRRHVPYSLRHNMKNRLRDAEVFQDVQKAIQGHALGSDVASAYGGRISLERMRDGLERALGLPSVDRNKNTADF